MQLINKSKLSLADKLAVAAAALVATSAGADSAAADATAAEDEWEFVGSVLAYSEPDRVSAAEFIFSADKNYSDTAKFSYKVVLDSLTGASASGAIEQNQVQTFTRPSGRGQYTIAAQETPLDDTFKDTRAQFNVSWTDALTETTRYTVGSNLSKEYDYQSLSFNAELARDFDRRNTTLSVGVSLAADTVDPEGGRPLAFSSMAERGQFVDDDAYMTAFNDTRVDGQGDLDTAELLLGWTQIVNRRMVMQLNYSYADVSGYLTDPFKILSVVDNNAVTQQYLYEKRPESRTQHTIFAATKYHLDDSVLDFSYRYLTNDWEIDSHTLDFRWHLFSGDADSNAGSFWEPHVRFYQQSAADFYYPYLVEGEALPEFASADYRIGEMTAVTLGLKYGLVLSGGNRAEIRAEYYKQTPKAAGAEKVAAVEAFDIYPEVDALILQFTYFF